MARTIEISTNTRRNAALVLLCVAEFVNVLGATVMIVALPSIGQSLGVQGGGLEWVAGAYALFFGSFLLLSGRAADLYGRRLFFMLGLAVFVAASLLCAVASSLAVLIAARAAQGLGAALVVPAALSLLTEIFPEGPGRSRAVGVWTAVAAGGGALGFFLGGVVSGTLGWRWVFVLNLPIGLLAVALAPRLLAESRVAQATRRLDLGGAASVTAGLLLLIYGLSRTQTYGFGVGTLGVLGLAALALGMFFWIEARAPNPLVPPSTWRSGALTGSSLVAFALTATTGAAAVLGTLYLQRVLGYSPTATGLAYAPFSLAVVVGSLLGTGLTHRLNVTFTMVLGLGIVAAAMLVSSGVGATSGLPYLMAGIVGSGLGLGCASVASTDAGISAVTEAERGLASGFLNASAQIGTAIGIAALGAVAGARSDALMGDGASSTALVAGYRLAFWVAAGGALVSAAAAVWLSWKKEPQ